MRLNRLVLCRVHDNLHLSNGMTRRHGSRDSVMNQIHRAPCCAEIAREGIVLEAVGLPRKQQDQRDEIDRVGGKIAT